MTNTKVVEVRVHTEIVKSNKDGDTTSRREMIIPQQWSQSVLILDCETTTDQSQALLFGGFMYCRAKGQLYVPVLEGMFYADDLDDSVIAVLAEYCRAKKLRPPLSRKQFLKRILFRAIRAESLIVGFNLPFDLSRIAMEVCWTQRGGGGWSFTMDQFIDSKTNELREDQYTPRLIIKPKDGKGAFFRLTKAAPVSEKRPRATKQYPPVRCLDLKTLIWALDNRSHSLDSACEAKGTPGKSEHTPSGCVSREEIEYNRQDVRATFRLLNVLRGEFDKHPIHLNPDRAYSPASIAKAYLEQMGIVPPREKFAIPPEILGIAMQSYFGGRAECRIRHTPLPIVHTDVRSEYPTVNALLGLWKCFTAERLRFADATEDARSLLSNLKLEDTFDPAFWKKLTFFALVRPSENILPVRTKYNGETTNIGVNILTSETPIWYAGPDLVAARLWSDRPLEIIRAVRVMPEGQQERLRPVALRGTVEIDPRKDDFFKGVIEARERVRADQSMSKADRDSLQYFLKILANSGSYGLFVELNPEKLGKNPKTGEPARAKLRVFSGEQQFSTTSSVIEQPGDWYCPVFGSLITAGGRLLLAMLELSVKQAGGIYMLCDTDSMAIVANKDGGLLACPGGEYWLDSGARAVKALSWENVREIVSRFERLNPYERGYGPASIIKIEDVNFVDGQQRELWGYAIAAKRYAFFEWTPEGDIRVVKASAHGLGFLYPPRRTKADADTPTWVVEAWEWILRNAHELPCPEPSWFQLPAMMRFTITTPAVLRTLQTRQKGMAYRDRAKPSNFILSPVIDPLGGVPVGSDANAFTLIAPFTSDPSRWHELTWINLHDGKSYKLGKPGNRLPYQAEARTYGDIVKEYRWHSEAKHVAPGGTKCMARTNGVLYRTTVVAAEELATIGKETNRRWEREDDISLLESRVIEYRPNETDKLITDIKLQSQIQKYAYATRALAKTAKVSRESVKAAKRGRRIRKSTAERLRRAIRKHSK